MSHHRHHTVTLFSPLMLQVATILAGVAAASVAASSVVVESNKSLSDVGDTFLGFTTDYWLNNGPYGDKWAPNGSILLVNLEDPKFRSLVKGLAPATWRIGGTPADSVVYDYGAPPECSPPVENPWPDTKCLSSKRWEEILAFGQATGVSISYGLNGLYGRKAPSEPMNTSNLQAFIEATVAMGDGAQALWAYQLGNELGNGGPGGWRATPEALANDVVRVRGILNALWEDESRRPLFVGPDSAPSSDYYDPYLKIAAHALNATTFHSYLCGSRGGGGGPCQDALLNPADIAIDDGAAHSTLGYAKNSPVPSLAVWGGEVGPAYGGGVTGLSDRYGDMLWWLDHLARLQAIGVQTFARSTLIGGSYELVNRSTHDPHPSYFAALAYSRLMGGRSISTRRSEESIIAYTTCTATRTTAEEADRVARTRGSPGSRPRTQEHIFPGQIGARKLRDSTLASSPCSSALLRDSGAVTVVVINGNETTPSAVNVSVEGYHGAGQACVWQFRSPAIGDEPVWGADGVQWYDAASQNWENLQVGPAPGYALPSLASPRTAPVSDGNVLVQLGAFEYAFVVIPDAGVQACRA